MDGNAAAVGDGPGNLHIARPSNQLLDARGQVATGDLCVQLSYELGPNLVMHRKWTSTSYANLCLK